MAKKKWHHRLREIAEKNPQALHPSLRGLAAEQAWARAAWHLDSASPEAAARPIRLILGWLLRKRLLTREGAEALRGTDAEQLALTRSMVLPRGQRFLDAHFEDWFAEAGINVILSEGDSLAERARSALDDRWSQQGPRRQ